MPQLFVVLMLGAFASLVHAEDNCEPIRAGIESNIASKGVTGFTVTVVDMDAPATGSVVGQCANGTRKIVYARSEESSAPGPVVPAAAASAAAAKPPAASPAVGAESKPAAPVQPAAVITVPGTGADRADTDIITECKDGSVTLGGSCKR